MYSEKTWSIFNEILKEKYHTIVFDPHEVAISKFHYTLFNSGLYIASKYAIIRSKFYTFQNYYSETGLASSGVLFLELKINENQSIIVGNTHLQDNIGNYIKGI